MIYSPKYVNLLQIIIKNTENKKVRCVLNDKFKCSLRTDTQITFSLHFTPLGIRLSSLVAQPGAFLVLETIILGYY